MVLLVVASPPAAALGRRQAEPSNGVATVRVAQTEYTIPLLCDDAQRPEMGFSTEPGRVTRERTGQSSGVNLRLRTWQDTDLVVVSLDRYVTWMPRPTSVAGVLSVETGMSPVTIMQDGAPVAYTYDMWNSGDRPVGLESMSVEARCGLPQPATPAVRNIGGGSVN